MIYRDIILVGYSLESDFKVIKVFGINNLYLILNISDISKNSDDFCLGLFE